MEEYIGESRWKRLARISILILIASRLKECVTKLRIRRKEIAREEREGDSVPERFRSASGSLHHDGGVDRVDWERKDYGSKENLISKLRVMMTEDGGLPASVVVAGDVEGTLVRFLEANDWNVTEARDALRRMIEWRTLKKMDNLLTKPSDETVQRVLCQSCPSSHHGFDKAGHPIHVELSGRYNWREVFKVCNEEELLETHLKMMEYQQRVLFAEASARSGKLVDKMCNIVDITGISLKILSPRAHEMFKRVQKTDQQMYPEMLAVTYVLNAPLAFRIIWRIIRVCLPQRERAKVRVLPGGSKGLAELKKYVDEEFIPVQMGGSCTTCNGKCVSGPSGSGDKPTFHMKMMLEDIRQTVWKGPESDLVSRNSMVRASDDTD